jgi:hypothetical protein
MSSNWESFFKKAEQEAERKRQEAAREAERQRQQADQRSRASIQRAISQFDWQLQSLLRGYAAAKMRGTANVSGPSPDSSNPTWRLECGGYIGVSVTLRLRPTLSGESGELEPVGFSIRGTDGGLSEARPSVTDVANALASSIPTVYTPPTCSCDGFRCIHAGGCGCVAHPPCHLHCGCDEMRDPCGSDWW